ncbi:MAG: SUKH-3 domain-containing protein [Kofleriaceae bacterium]|nr:SUKH-3 domain-containing protein [Kofleriaceae bacterium]
MIAPSARTAPSFVAAGWDPSRRVPVPAYVSGDHPAWQVLSRFGGLTVGSCGAGVECATSDVAFGACAPDAQDDDLAAWQRLLSTTLVIVATVHHDHGELLVDSSSRYFGRSLVHDAFYFHGDSFAAALDGLLLGLRPRPMLRPGQRVVSMFGIDITADSPELYRPTDG